MTAQDFWCKALPLEEQTGREARARQGEASIEARGCGAAESRVRRGFQPGPAAARGLNQARPTY